MILKNRIIHLKGQEYYILGGMPTVDDPKRGVYLLNSALEANQTPDYSLWNVEFPNEGSKIKLWPYTGEYSEDLKKELLEDFLKHAFDEG